MRKVMYSEIWLNVQAFYHMEKHIHQSCYNKSVSQTVHLVVLSASAGSVRDTNRTVVLHRERSKFIGFALSLKKRKKKKNKDASIYI
jgi:hypothetical protein